MEYRDATISRTTRDVLEILTAATHRLAPFERAAIADVVHRWDANDETAIDLDPATADAADG